jgi:hypothetical protein
MKLARLLLVVASPMSVIVSFSMSAIGGGCARQRAMG